MAFVRRVIKRLTYLLTYLGFVYVLVCQLLPSWTVVNKHTYSIQYNHDYVISHTPLQQRGFVPVSGHLDCESTGVPEILEFSTLA